MELDRLLLQVHWGRWYVALRWTWTQTPHRQTRHVKFRKQGGHEALGGMVKNYFFDSYSIHFFHIDAHSLLCIDVCRYKYARNVSFVRI